MFWEIKGWPLYIFMIISIPIVFIFGVMSFPQNLGVFLPLFIGIFFRTDKKIRRKGGSLTPETWADRIILLSLVIFLMSWLFSQLVSW